VTARAAHGGAQRRPGRPDAGRRLILLMSVSLDGFVARPDGVIDWLAEDDERIADHGDQRHRVTLELLGQIGLIVLGRGAYEDMVRGWPGSDNPMARLMNTLPKVVFSQSLSGVDWNNARLTRRPLEEEIPELKREAGSDMIVFGGARIAHSLIRGRLVDEYRLTVHPVALGAGLSLMHGLPEPQRLELVSSTAYADGCVTQVLRPA
jgi:dihydrofolate reductase